MAILKIHPKNVDRTRSQLHEIVYVAAIQREIGDLSGIYRGSQLRVFSIDRSRFAGHFDHFAGLAKFHPDVNALDGSCIQCQIRVAAGLETFGFSRNFVGPDRKFPGGIQTALVRSRGDRQVCTHVGHGHFGVRDGRARRVGYCAGKLAILDLGECTKRDEQH